MRLDTRLAIETPEGAEIELYPAGIFVRGLALLLDELLRWTVIFVASVVLVVLGRLGTGLFLVVLFLSYWIYGVAFEVLANGMTPGKRMMGVQVVHADGTPIRLPASMVRNLLLVVDLLPVFYGAGLVTMMLSPRFQRIGDLAADTLVVYRQQRRPAPAAAQAETMAPPLPLTLPEQQAILGFAERTDRLSPDRARELANTLAPMLGRRDDEAVRSLRAIAGSLWGRL